MSVEGDIQAAILEAFHDMGVLAWRVQSGTVKVRGGRMNLAPAGTPDIHVLVPPNGRFLGLEVKAPDGRVRAAQIAWHERARRDGAAVAVVRSVAEAIAAFREAA